MEKVHFFDAIESNKRKSLLLVGGMFLLSLFFLWFVIFFFIGSFVIAAILSLIISSIYIYFSYNHGMNLILGISNAKPLDRSRYPYLHHSVEGLSIAAGIPVPKTYIIDDSAPNAFATGKDPKHSSIVVTKGLLEKLNKREVSGVVAHEVSHIANYDIRYMMIAVVIVGFIAVVSHVFARSLIYSSSGSRKGGAVGIVVGIALMLLAPLFAELVRFAISREREYLADANGARLTRDPKALASALLKVSGSKTSVRAASRETAPLYFSDPIVGKFHGLFASHPPIPERVKRLERM